MLNNVSYYLILGKPLMFYMGILTLTSLLATATLGYLLHKGKVKFKYHRAAAITTILLALTHGTFGVLAYL